MLNRLGIFQKLLLMLLAPVLALLFFAFNGVFEKRGEATAMEQTTAVTGLAVAASTLVHELQIERGLSIGYLAARGERFAADLRNQHGAADRARQAYAERLDPLLAAGDLSADLIRVLRAATEDLGRLAARRGAVLDQNLAAGEAADYYTNLNAQLLAIVATIARESDNAEIATRLSAFYAFLRFKEDVGLERALLNGVFTLNRFEGDQLRTFLTLLGEQQGMIELFESLAPDQLVAEFRSRAQGAAFRDVAALENRAIELAQRGRFDVDPGVWFRTATEKIEVLREQESRIGQDVIDLADGLRAAATAMFWFFLVLVVIALAVSAGLAYVLARSISHQLTRSSDAAREIAAQIVTAVQQQAAATNETVTSISETTTTVDEIRQTSEMAKEKSQLVSDAAEQSLAVSTEVAATIEHGVEAMRRIREEVESIARNILELSEKNIQIGEIVQSVNAIAEQSNLLAVNASIEAAKAGEHGKGFSVVANEVKALAGQSKEATTQIRSILAEIQKSSNAAVMVTEQGTKRVEEGSSLIGELGSSFDNLSRVVAENADIAAQISAAAHQQQVGVEQITSAMQAIEGASKDNAAGFRQLEVAAREVENISMQLVALVRGSRGLS